MKCILPGGGGDVVDFKDCGYLCHNFCKIQLAVLYCITLYLLYRYLVPEGGQ